MRKQLIYGSFEMTEVILSSIMQVDNPGNKMCSGKPFLLAAKRQETA